MKYGRSYEVGKPTRGAVALHFVATGGEGRETVRQPNSALGRVQEPGAFRVRLRSSGQPRTRLPRTTQAQ